MTTLESFTGNRDSLFFSPEMFLKSEKRLDFPLNNYDVRLQEKGTKKGQEILDHAVTVFLGEIILVCVLAAKKKARGKIVLKLEN